MKCTENTDVDSSQKTVIIRPRYKTLLKWILHVLDNSKYTEEAVVKLTTSMLPVTTFLIL
jgi:hypothetical protein